jgi:hypothetical protein
MTWRTTPAESCPEGDRQCLARSATVDCNRRRSLGDPEAVGGKRQLLEVLAEAKQQRPP